MMKSFFWMATVLISFTWAQTENYTPPEPLTLSPEILDKIGGIDEQDPEDKSIPQIVEKCQKHGGFKAYKNAKEGFANFSKCLENIVNLTQLKQEIEDAKPTGAVNEVINKYCNRKPEFEQCFQNMRDVVESCLAPDEAKNYGSLKNVTKQLSEFICDKNGSRVALFIAEDGEDCLKEQKINIEKCFSTTLGQNITFSADPINLILMPSLSFDEESCNQTSALQRCSVNSLRNCNKSTTADIVESLLEYVRKDTLCQTFARNPNAATSIQLTSAILLTMATVIMYY